MRLFFLLLSVFFVGLQPIGSAEALTVSPLRLEYEAAPEQMIVDTIKVSNETSTGTIVAPVVRDFIASGDGSGTPVFVGEEEQPKSSLKDWVSFSIERVALQPGDSREVTFTIQVPKGASSGGYFGAILFSTVPASDESVLIQTEVGALVLISVPGDAKQEGALIDVQAGQRLVSHLPVSFTASFENTGEVHLKPSGEVHIMNLFGREVVSLPINPDGGNVLPGSTRALMVSWQHQEVPSETIEIVKEWQNFALGRYTATFAVDDGTGEIENATVAFWVIPWQLLIVALVVLILLIAIAKQHRKNKMIGSV